jgi:Rieske Fe-S protein
MKAGLEFLKQNLNVAAQYGEWFDAKPKPDLSRLKPGEGTVFREGMKMIAAYKDLSGDVQYMSGVCTHLGGVVSWNNAEKSWDCPCHGARYSCHGHVIEGPASVDLKPLESPTSPRLLRSERDIMSREEIHPGL